MERAFDVVVVGGGLAGLTAATYLGRAGLEVLVVEKAKELGGRARTTDSGGFSLNFGAHALYRMGHAWTILEELGVPVAGGIPKVTGALALTDGGAHALPVGLLSMLTTGLLPLAGKLELARVLVALGSVDVAGLASTPAATWIERVAKNQAARNFLAGFFRVATYSGDMERLSAGAAIAQLRLVQKHNVLYLDRGWQTLVDGLRAQASAAGATLATGDGATRVTVRGPGDLAVTLHDGEVTARAVVLATGPQAAAALAPELSGLAELAAATRPVKVAALDLGLAKVPRPRVTFGLGTDRPTYVSVHSAVAQLAPAGGGAVVHALLYTRSGDAQADERELEGALDVVQPGWREQVIERRFLPSIVASNALIEAARGGLAGRAGVAVAGAEGLFVAGDWVGDEGMLLDAAMASARRAARECAALLASGRAERRDENRAIKGEARRPAKSGAEPAALA